jgi:hypothetical protein
MGLYVVFTTRLMRRDPTLEIRVNTQVDQTPRLSNMPDINACATKKKKTPSKCSSFPKVASTHDTA